MENQRALVEGNLAKMTGGRKGEMGFCAIRESMGGNAGCHEGMPCIGVNFSFDKNTGEIKYFGNIQDVPKEIAEAFARGTFRIALNPERGYESRIIQKIYALPLRELPDFARETIREAVRQYNARASAKPR